MDGKSAFIGGAVVLALVFFIGVIPEVDFDSNPFFRGVHSVATVGAQYVFGIGESILEWGGSTFASEESAILTGIMIWFIVFITFGDIISVFSSFSKSISWGVAFALAVIAANVGLIGVVFGWITGVFIWAGGFAVYAGLLASFILFFAINWGWSGLASRIIEGRKKIASEAGAESVASGIKTLGRVDQATREVADEDR